MEIIIFILLLITLIMFPICQIGVSMFNQFFFKFGIVFCKHNFNINKNYIANSNIGKKISKRDVEIKILNETTILFYSDFLKSIPIIPYIIFGECKILNNNVTIKYKNSLFYVLFVLSGVIFTISLYFTNSTKIIMIFIPIMIVIGISVYFHYFIYNKIKVSIEDYVSKI